MPSARRQLQAVAVLLISALLGSCTGLTPLPPAGGRVADQRLAVWHLEGKLGFRNPQDNGSAWIDWRQQGEVFNIQLSGPLGASATRISGDARIATLEQSGEPPVSAANATTLARQLFGWDFPAEQLRFWARGIPDPKIGTGARETDSNGVLVGLHQAGWQLTFARHVQVDGWLLPGRISAIGRQGEFTLVIKNWQVDEAANASPAE